MSRRPPTPTLFPYTTLFRSLRARPVEPGRVHDRRQRGGELGRRPLPQERVHGQPCAVGAARVDRKSTRLNSSHSQISYAVFCLKKKSQILSYIFLSSFAIVA